ncbi:hypothetical protein OG455_17630 [Kitasatospora sp. NBC_01287]|uniref:hypothetical protein n=1 Tax=Kitasatospora sp. NBC_01287 TaxID=2903573 RepID=UPI00225A4B86|nr:hypothetical protein [Kitasatospora sp. NBC_01287]MCX4747320.1 hypothetical protein [Kitasatospora sp. NBC_01287]
MKTASRMVAIVVSGLALISSAGAANAAEGQPTAPASPAHAQHAAKPNAVRPNIYGGNCGEPDQSCTSLSNGTLYLSVTPDANTWGNWDINDWYTKTGGGQISADFQYNSGSGIQNDEGTFTENKGQTKYYTWYNTGLPGCPQVVGILAVVDQGNFQTPPIYMC